jgi:glycosyltransferase involved in cell wall biosynthesis
MEDRGHKKIKVLRIKSRLTVGGPDIHVLLLNTGLNKERFESYLAVGTVEAGEPDMTHLANELGINLFVIPELKRDINLWRDSIALIKLYRLMGKIKPDIVHTHTAKAGTLGRLAAILSGVPIKIHTYHGHIFHSYFGRFRTRFFIFIERLLSRFADRIIVISKNQLKDVKDVYKIAPKERCPLIPLGLDLEPFLKEAVREDAASSDLGGFKKRSSISGGTLLVGIIGRLVDVKNHKMFLDVLRQLKLKAPDIDVKFLIVGGGGLRDSLESYARMLNIENSVIFKGCLPELTGGRSELVSIYKDLDVVALTSLNEGTPISLIEAMASGKAVISTDVGGVRDVVSQNETGFLSPAGDVGQFSSNLLQLLQDKDRRVEMGLKGRRFVAERFSKERLFRDIELLYEELYGEKRHKNTLRTSRRVAAKPDKIYGQ